MKRMAAFPRTWRIVRAVWVALGVAALIGPLAAQQPTTAQRNAVKQSCRADFQTHCVGVPTGGSAAMGCLQQNAATLSPPCQQALAAIGGASGGAPPAEAAPPPQLSPRQRANVLRHACGVDFQAYCHGVQPGGGRALACLMEHQDTLSPGCQKALQSAHR
jgi:hypothetical protein